MSINICKECGKEFEASSARVAYCSDIHYRPCPICGKPVVAKYLSDPARRCDECKNKGKMVPQTRMSIQPINLEITEIVEGEAQAAEANSTNKYTYNGPQILGFIPGHDYLIEAQWNGLSAYEVTAKFDFTDDSEVELFMLLSSTISVGQYFKQA